MGAEGGPSGTSEGTPPRLQIRSLRPLVYGVRGFEAAYPSGLSGVHARVPVVVPIQEASLRIASMGVIRRSLRRGEGGGRRRWRWRWRLPMLIENEARWVSSS